MTDLNLTPESVLTAITAVYSVVNVIARITPTPKDDAITSKIGKVLNYIFLWSKTK